MAVNRICIKIAAARHNQTWPALNHEYAMRRLAPFVSFAPNDPDHYAKIIILGAASCLPVARPTR
jgi:hypothetical protein